MYRNHGVGATCQLFGDAIRGLASDDVTKHSNAWQRGKLVLNKDSVPYKSMLGAREASDWVKLFIPLQKGLKGFDNSFTGYINTKNYWK